MIINNLDIVSLAPDPPEADPPLIIDPDTMLAVLIYQKNSYNRPIRENINREGDKALTKPELVFQASDISFKVGIAS